MLALVRASESLPERFVIGGETAPTLPVWFGIAQRLRETTLKGSQAGQTPTRARGQWTVSVANPALRQAPPEIKRQVFASFDLQIAYDKAEGRVELAATVPEAVVDAFENAKTLQAEGSSVVVSDIAGAGFEPATSGL